MSAQRIVEFYIYVSGNYTDSQTFLNNLETSSASLGYLRNGTTFTKIGDASTVNEHSAETEFYPLITSAYITGLSVSSTITFNNVNWN